MEIIMEIKSLFANGKEKAFTMSYDDGNYDGDKQLIGIFNKYGIKGTFHLNGHNYVPGGWAYDKVDELKKLYSGHEVSMHGYTHPFFNSLPNGEKFFELYEDKKALEGFAGYPIRGMSYPFGDYDDKTLDMMTDLGINYSRTVRSTHRFDIPRNFKLWDPTNHHADKAFEMLENFKNYSYKSTPPLFYMWGHSYEYNKENASFTWDDLDRFCAEISKLGNVWFATNIEIFDYVTALRRIEMSIDRKMIYNPSALSVWLCIDGQKTEIKPGVVTNL